MPHPRPAKDLQLAKRRPVAARRRELLLESCEERILCDAAPAVAPAASQEQLAAAAKAQQAKSDAAGEVAAGTTPATAVETTVQPAELRVPFSDFSATPAAAPAPANPEVAAATASTTPSPTAGEGTSAPAAGVSTLTDAQRASVNDVIRDSTEQIWFQENVGQFPEGVRYGFKTTFGSMLVYDDHLRILSNQWDATTGAVGVQAVDITFPGGTGPWQIVPGGASAVTGSYQQPDGTTITPRISKELTLQNVYNGVDLRLYSAENGVLEFDWIVAKAQDYEKIRIAANGQDSLVFNADGSATLDLRYQDLTLHMPEIYQVIDGQKHALGGAMVAGETPGTMKYQLTGEIVRDQPLVIDPNVVWSTYFDLNDSTAPFDSYVFSVNANTNGTYVSGWVGEIVTNGSFGGYMQVNAGFSQGTVANQTYVYRFSNDGLNITAWTSTGVTSPTGGVTNQKLGAVPADLELFPDGRVIVGFGNGVVHIYSADLATRSYAGTPVTMDTLNSIAVVDNDTFYVGGRVAAAIPVAQIPAANMGPDSTFGGTLEGVIIRYTSATTTPTPSWATYVGGDGQEYFTAVALTPDKTKLVFATSTSGGTLASFGTLVNAVDSTISGTELIIGVLPEQATKPAAFNVLSFLGGSGDEGTVATDTMAALVTATDTYFYVGGTTNSTDLPGTTGGAQAANGGGTFDAFASRISLSGGATGFQSTYMGGAGQDRVGGIAYDIRADRLLIFGTTTGSFPTLDTVPASNYYDNSFGGGTYDIFVATVNGALTVKDYGTYIGGASNDYLGQTGELVGQGHVVYSQATGLTYLATTVHSSDLPASVIGTPPGKDTAKSNTTNDTHFVIAFNINSFDFGDAPLSYENGTPAQEAISSTLRLGASVDAEATAQSSANALGDDNFTSDDEDAVATLPLLFTTSTNYSVNVSVLNNTGATQTLRGWIDFNANGLFEAGEVASVSVVSNASQQNVTLTWASLPSMTAGATFMRLRISTATLTDNAGTASVDERSVGNGGSGEIEDYALTIQTLSSIAGTVYRDSNNDGAKAGASETGVSGVTVTLTGTNDLGAAVNLTATTDASGNYSFTGLRPSNGTGYTLTETQPASLLDGKETAGTSGGTVNNTATSQTISGISLAPSTTATGYLFGELVPAAVAGTVFHDQNANGAQNAGEPGISGVTVTLTGTDDRGNTVSTTATTDGTGAYSFSGLRPGTYTLTETQPAGYLDGKETAGTLGGTVNNTAISQTISTFTIAAGDAGTGYLFAEVQSNSLAGTVYRDLNNNGAIDAGETGVSGATITLTGTDDFGQAVSTTATTTAAGAYSFAGLRPGTYVLTETQPAGLLDGRDTLGTVNAVANGTAGNDTFTAVVLQSAGTGANYNFGELPASSVAGRVYDDRNNNGVVDAGENGIGSISIQLTGTDDLGNAVSLSTTTAADGTYSFGSLRPGSYTVKQPTQPAAFLDGKETAGSLGGSVATNEQIGPFTLSANTAATGYNFGELTGSSLSGIAYVDANNNGVVDAGETLLPGIGIALTGTDDRGQAVSLSTTTNASGAYSFTNLRPGTYLLTETQPGAYLDGKETVGAQASGTINNAANSNTISAITLTPATTGSGNNFGELAPSSLAGSIWSDANNNGLFDAGETPIVGATVTLTGTDDRGAAVNTTATTSATGAYTFANLRPGSYVLTETQPAGFLDGKDAVGSQGGTLGNDTFTAITLAQGATGVNNNFAELAPAALSGTVYRDLNNNGAQSGAGETGISGVTVTLTGTNDLGAAVSVTATTDASGNYSFANVRPGTYTLTETQPAGFLDGRETAGVLGGTVDNAAVSQTISNFTVTAGANGTGYLFGELAAASLSGTVFRDDNSDGAKQAAEPGIATVDVVLSGTDDFGNAVSITATTDAAGAYSFTGLRPGSYTLTETQPAGYLDGKETAGSKGGSVNNTAVSQTISTFTLAANDAATGYLFAEVQANSLAGTVYRDLNNNGLIEAGETGVSSATITLTGTDDFGQAVNTTATTTATGAYSFAGLRPGTYVITETQPAGLLDGRDTLGTVNAVANGTAGNDTFTAVVLQSAGTGANYNFGELPASSVAGRVFDDRNNNGTVDAGENGIGSVTLQLTGTDDLGNAVSLSTTTSAAGAYTFSNLRPGTYTVTEPTQPAGFLDGKEGAGTSGGSVATNEQIGPFTLAANTNATGYRFGELTPSSLSGTVYVDANNNGVVDGGETLLPGINIALTGTDDLGQAVSLNATTDATGAYSFTNLRPGTYTLTETQPGAYFDGKETVGAQASGTINNGANSNTISAITLTPATTGSGNNFGELTPSSLAGSIWSDANNNGVFDAGETPIAGATVTLTGTDDRGAAISTTATTNAAGLYTFANLRPGTYTLTETQPAGFLDGKDTLGSQGGTLGNDTVTAITLAQGVTGTNNNFAELAPAALSGTVYRDLNNNGVQSGAGETGISGVLITLTGTDDLGAAVSVTATTDASGNYAFANVRPGTYMLTETQPGGFLDGKETAGLLGGTVNNAAVSQTISNFAVTAGATGTGYLFGELPAASLSGSVYRDENNDGAKQAGEPGLNAVNITLTGSDDLGNAVSVSTSTDASGAYSFTGLRPGTYTLTETQPAAYLDGKETAGVLGGTVDNTTNSNSISAITVAAGANGTGNLFGELQGAGITGNVYIDANNNGVLNAGEAPISGVTITLTGTDDRGQAVSTTATSDATGAYAFANLRPGTYTVTETQPAAYLDGLDTAGTPGGGVAGNDVVSGITVASGVTSAANNFGELPASSIAGAAYIDANNDGVFNAGETALPGVIITLTGTNDLGQPVSATTITSATGAFSFSGLRPGTYAVTETQPAAYLDGKDTAGTLGGGAAGNDTVTNITLASGVASTGHTFGELRPSSLAGSVYLDANNNAAFDAGDTAIAGASVTLTGTDDLGNAVNVTATTSAGGGYAFNNLRPGSYTLTETQPAGYLDGQDTRGTQGGTLGNDTISAITLTEGTTGTGNNFGELQGASIAGSVYRDANNNGVPEAGENGVSGVTITLTGTDDLGQAVSLSTTTNATGAYAFSNLRPGTYSLAEAQPAGLLDGTDTAGTPGGGTAGNDLITGITLVSGRASAGNNFGELDAASISGSVYIDANNDGIFQAGETPRGGVTLTLTGTDDLGGSISLTTTTNATGLYSFANLRPGTYTVTETQPAGLLDGKDTAGAIGGGTAGNDVISGITLVPARASASNNFAELRPSSIGGSIWSDANNNGAFDAGESPISGVTVTLTGTDDLGTAVSLTTTTNASGAYVFNTLRPGTYVLTETQPAGFLDGKDTLGAQGGTLGNDTITGITLTEGTNGTGNNFAELAPASLSGTVYRDLNNDGAKAGAGETGVAGVTVTVTGTDDLGQPVSLSTTTDPSGNYAFANLRPGTYTLTETQPAGLLDGKETAGVLSGTVDNTTNSNTISGIVVAVGANGSGNLFGELPASSLAGSVYNDANNNGVRDGGEAPIAGVTVTLTGTDDRNNPVTFTATTDATGAYSFSGLRPGSYAIAEAQPAGFSDGKDAAGTAGGTAAAQPGDTISGITLAAATDATGYTFGERANSSLSGSVYNDANNDGLRGGGETGISGIQVLLVGTDYLGNAVSVTVTTDATGAYSFTNIAPSDAAGYTLIELTQPAGYLDGKETAGTTGGTVDNTTDSQTITGIVLPAGVVSSGNLFGEIQGSNLSGVIYRDLNNDGLQAGAGETGIAGVTVTVTGIDDRGSTVNFTATSDATGAYSFTSLRPSSGAGYTLTESQPAGFLDGRNTVGSQNGSTINNPASDVIQTVAITSGTNGTGNNFGELPPASLSGFAYNDANNDGLRGAGEAIQPGVTITLTGIDDLGNPVSTSAVTDATGAYSFNNLRPGTYTLTESQPAGLLDGKETAGSQGSGTVDNASNSNTISAITLSAGQNGTDNNFADLTGGTFSGAVYRDLNNDGVRDAGETGIAGASITISGTDDRGALVNVTVTTDATGAYVFNTLRPGTYTLTEAQPAGFLDGKETRGTIDATAAGTTGNDQFTGLTLAPGATAVSYNFGELSAASLSGTVYRDDNNDGTRQAGEPGLGSVTVTLTGTDDLGNAVSLTLQSAADGTYSFTGLRPGTYSLTETQPVSLLDGKDTPGSLGGSAASVPGDTISGIVVGSQQDGAGYNFGELAGSSIAGTVYVDANNNGVLDAGETLLPGVNLTLTGTNDLGQAVTVSATTNASGAYTFSNLRPGTYTVSEAQPAGYLDGKDAAGTLPGTVAGVPGDAINAIALPSNTTATGYTFGELRASTLSGAVFADADNDGVQDLGEGGIATTITLTGTDDLGQPVSVTVTSDATTGAYNFSGLRPGSYTITETQPAAFLDGRDALGTAGGTPTNDKVSAITVTEGTNGTGYTFGELAGSALSGTVYRDDNNNGLLDGGETPIAGVTITLTGTDDLGNAVSLTATSNAAGAYSFANLRPSNAAGYTITETEPAGYLMGKNTVGTQNGTTTNNPPSSFIQTAQIVAGTNGTGNNFGELAASSLSGTAYVDADNDGVLDAGETRLPGVAITLSGTNDLGQPVSVSTTTDATGAYSFSGLRPGTYAVSETQPAGFLDGLDTPGTALGTAAAVPGDTISAITLNSNTPAAGYNFGELRGASLAGVVFTDANNDGSQQAGESGVGGVSVRLRGVDDLGNVIDTTITTQPDGTYSFNNLRPGTYRVTETQPAGLLDGQDAFGTRGGTVANDDISGIVLREGDAATGYTFGEIGGSRVTGTVFDDRNNDGVRDPSEAGIPGALITLTGTDDLGQPVTLSVSTDQNGNYQFTGLRPGAYTLTETQPAGYLDGIDTEGTAGGTPAGVPGDTISAITLTSSTNADGYLFAELTPAQLSGMVYRDDSNDGIRQAGEPGIGNVTVTLTGTDDLGNSVTLSTTTQPDGTYTFANLRPGSYTLTETQPAGYFDNMDSAGSQGGDVAGSPGDTISNFDVAPGQSGANNNFGELLGSSISGIVFDDRDNNGAFGAGDELLPGQTVTLTGTNDLGQPVSMTMVTDPAGAYSFGGLRPGTYTLTETQPAGFFDGKDTPGSLNGIAGPVGGDTITGITLPSNTAATGYTFAEVAPSSLSGSVFADANNDGNRDPGDNGIGGVTVTLTGTDDLGQPVNTTLTTQPDGTYSFANLRPGTYTITETQPAAYLDGTDRAGTLNGTAGNDTVSGIVVTPGQTGTGYTFGEQLTSVIGKVFVDRNRDGVQDPGETGLSGVTVTLRDQNGNFVTSTTTGPDGSYAFSNLVSGPYQVIETQPTGYGSSPSTPNTVNVNVTTTGNVIQFGETVSTLSGTVYFDRNASGGLNAGDLGLSGIAVTLTGTDANGTAVNLTTTTLADGTYHFDDLLSGTYTVTAAQPAGYRDGAETAGSFSGSLAINDSISAINVPTGQDGAGYNFGELGNPITGVVYRDDDKDGTRDAGEPGLPGITIELVDPNTNIVIATTTTGNDGRYTFDNLPPGTYTVRETQPGGYADTTPNVVPVTVSSPGPEDVNFGEKLGSFTGRVFQDRNNDGVQDPGEPGIAGATVTLTGTDANGVAVNRTATTNALGDYVFDNVLGGTYTLTETQPAGYTDGKDTAGTSNGTLSGTDAITGIVLGAGVDATGYTYGELGATDLTIAKTDGVTEATPGQLITYTVTVSNQGVQDAAGVVVSDQFPMSDLEFVSASNGGVFDVLTGTITWQLGDVTGNGQEVVTLTIQARVRDVIPAGHERVTNVVTVTDDGTVPDSDPTNNRATDEDRLIAQPDLYVVKTDGLTTAQVGQTVTYTLTGGNAGNQVAEGVTVTDALPPGLRFVSASNGGRIVNGQVVWKLSDLQPGDSFRITVTVVVEEAAAGQNAHNTAKIDDRYGSFEDPTPRNNRSSDDTTIPSLPPPPSTPRTPPTGPAPLFYDLFNREHNTNFRSFDRTVSDDPFSRPPSVLDVWRDPILPLAPIYSGEADPGSTLVIELYNANGDRIGEQTVVVDAGGNWLASFPSSQIKDYPSGVRITEYAASYASPATAGHNLRNFFAPALNAGQFAFGGQDTTPLDPRATAPLLSGLNLGNPLDLGDVKYGSELLPSTGAPAGY